nr:hypothetical protein [Pseudomonadota bacterium]
VVQERLLAPEEAFRLEGEADVAVVVSLAPGQKCDRCWQILPEVGTVKTHPTACKRCAGAVTT